jgi:hypothetical protein
MSTISLDMLLGLPHLEMVSWGGIYRRQPHFYPFERKHQLSIDGRTRQSNAHQTGHCSLSGTYHVRRPLGSVAVNHWIRLLPRLSGAHQTVWCYSPRVPVCGPSAQTVRLSHGTVRCTLDSYCSLSGVPSGAG